MSPQLERVQVLPEADFEANGGEVEVSIVMPCLNEADTRRNRFWRVRC